MLRRTRSALVAVGVVAALGVAAPAALGQTYPPSTTTTTTSTSTTSTTAAPTTTTTAPLAAVCTSIVTASAPLVPGASVNVSGTCVELVDGDSVSGVLNSTPIALPVVKVVGDTATFPVKLPADWELNAFHNLTITKAGTGQLLMNARFYVDCKGNITPPSKGCGGNLPKTGSNNTGDIAQAGVVLVAAGAAVVLVARKRRRSTAPVA